jgi:multidrug efflux system outer membrane protein
MRESLGAEAQLLQQRDNAVSLHAQALSTDLALIKALGGGYHASSPDHASTAPSPTDSPTNLAGDATHERH